MPVFDPIKIRVDPNKKAKQQNNSRLEKRALNMQEETEMIEKSSYKSSIPSSSRKKRGGGEKVENYFDFSEKLQPK